MASSPDPRRRIETPRGLSYGRVGRPRPRSITRATCAGRQGAGTVLRGFRHLRAQLLRACRPGRGDHVAEGRATRAYALGGEHGWDNYGPAHLADVRAAIDHNGKIAAYEYHGWQHAWICAVARSTDTSAIPAAVVSSLTMVPTPRGRPSRGRFQSDISATARRLHPWLALGQRKPERDQVETAVLSDLLEEAFRGEGVVRFASKKALAIATSPASIG
jgi:hypothetical protein